jgi:hypothetical protein
VAVDEDRRRALAVGAQLTDDERRVIPVLDQLPGAAGGLDLAQRPARGLQQRLGVAAGRRDRRDPQPVAELGDGVA